MNVDDYNKYPAFLYKLSKLYNGKKFCVRWFMQESTFSYEIYKASEAFFPGRAIFVSEVFWHGNDSLHVILNDISNNLKRLKEETEVKVIPLNSKFTSDTHVPNYCECISRTGVDGEEHGPWTCCSCKKLVKKSC